MEKLEDIRKRINSIDASLAELFEQRMAECAKVYLYKKVNGLAINDPAREAEVIRRNAELVKDDTLREYYVNFQKSVMALSVDYQNRLMSGIKVAYVGDESSASCHAAQTLFPDAALKAYADYEKAYAACSTGECDITVLPLENSVTGYVSSVTDIMFSGDLYVNQALEVSDSEGATTRYGVFSRTLSMAGSSAKMGRHFIMMFTVKNEAGALAKTLNIIGAHNFNMTNLHSRPMKTLMWDYYFYMEIEGDVTSEEGREMLSELGTLCDRLKLVGSYTKR